MTHFPESIILDSEKWLAKVHQHIFQHRIPQEMCLDISFHVCTDFEPRFSASNAIAQTTRLSRLNRNKIPKLQPLSRVLKTSNLPIAY